MKILFLAHRIPVPPNKGEKIRAFYMLRHLGREHAVDLLALVDDPRDRAHLDLLADVCRRCEVVTHGPARRWWAVPRAITSGTAITLASFHSPELAEIARRWQHDNDYDAVLAFSSTMAQYVDAGGHFQRVMDFVDVDSAKWEQYGRQAMWPLSWLYRREGRLIAAWEAAVARRFDVSTFVSEPEAALFRTRVPDARDVRVVANGVAERFLADGWQPRHGAPDATANLVFLGTMDYRPNIDGVVWFAKTILPKVQQAAPGTSFTIIGGRPTMAVRRLGQRPGVRLTGFVEDLVAELTRADLFVAPLRIARGVQNKVLEALAFGLPVVATPQALEGIDAVPGDHLLVAADPDGFAAAVIGLLRRPEQAHAMGQAARRHMASHYRWDQALAPLTELFRTLEPVEIV
jgi:sugar transferase (PEP-CTERM/EpsH1 system associated)